MGDRIARLYQQGRIDADGVKNALDKGLITEDQYKQILMSGAELKPNDAAENHD